MKLTEKVEWIPTGEVKVGDRIACLLSDAHAYPTVTGWNDKVIDLSRYGLPVSKYRIFTVSEDVHWWIDESMRTNDLERETLIVARSTQNND